MTRGHALSNLARTTTNLRALRNKLAVFSKREKTLLDYIAALESLSVLRGMQTDAVMAEISRTKKLTLSKPRAPKP